MSGRRPKAAGRHRSPGNGTAWSGPALALGQLALMGTSLCFSLCLGYAGGLSAVGAAALAMLVFQLATGVLQRSLAEATLLAGTHADRRADPATCRWSVAAALLGGALGTVAAVLATVVVPGSALGLALPYALGIPGAIALDIGRSAAVAAGAGRAAFAETAAWLSVQVALMGWFAAARSPLGICLSWSLTNVAFCAVAAAWPHRRPALRGLGSWVRSRWTLMGTSSLDALLYGLAPLLAMQVAAFVASTATLGGIRVLQQLFAPLAFVAFTLRRILVYRRRAEVRTTVRQELRDGLVSFVLLGAGAAALGVAVVFGRHTVDWLAFVPAGVVAVAAAGFDRAALGFALGCSLGRFMRAEFALLLRARLVAVGCAVIIAPVLTAWWGAAGYLLGSATALIVYGFLALLLPRSDAYPDHRPDRAATQRSPSRAGG